MSRCSTRTRLVTPVPRTAHSGGGLDVTATFGFLAAVTSKLRFGTGVALVPQRNPIYTAKEMCTLDWLTEGFFFWGGGVGGIAAPAG